LVLGAFFDAGLRAVVADFRDGAVLFFPAAFFPRFFDTARLVFVVPVALPDVERAVCLTRPGVCFFCAL
jgi:hypothetical protein